MATDADRSAPARLIALILYYATLAAIGLSPLASEARLWGLDWYRYYPSYVTILVLVVAAMLPLLILRIFRSTDGPGAARPKSFLLFGAGVAIAYVAAMIVWRGRTQFLGDGHQVLFHLAPFPDLLDL